MLETILLIAVVTLVIAGCLACIVAAYLVRVIVSGEGEDEHDRY